MEHTWIDGIDACRSNNKFQSLTDVNDIEAIVDGNFGSKICGKILCVAFTITLFSLI